MVTVDDVKLVDLIYKNLKSEADVKIKRGERKATTIDNLPKGKYNPKRYPRMSKDRYII